MRRFVLVGCLLVGCGNDTDAGGGDDTPTPKDAPLPTDAAPSDAPVSPIDAAFGPGAACTASTCSAPQGCCTGAMITCKAEADCPTQWFECDGPEDCNGGTCCFGNGGQGGSTCKAAGQSCTAPACHYDSDCGGAASKCCAKPQTLYKVCQAAC